MVMVVVLVVVVMMMMTTTSRRSRRSRSGQSASVRVWEGETSEMLTADSRGEDESRENKHEESPASHPLPGLWCDSPYDQPANDDQA